MLSPYIKSLVQVILENPLGFKWSLQGFGMLRTYLPGNRRLHVWSKDHAVKGVSEIHTHPWSFSSLIIAGEVVNVRYASVDYNGLPFMQQAIKCGEGGGLVDAPEPVRLRVEHTDLFKQGDCYHQNSTGIHSSHPEGGSVTLITRKVEKDPDHALVFWEAGTEWVSAEPRPATADEVLDITRYALQKWF